MFFNIFTKCFVKKLKKNFYLMIIKKIFLESVTLYLMNMILSMHILNPNFKSY